MNNIVEVKYDNGDYWITTKKYREGFWSYYITDPNEKGVSTFDGYPLSASFFGTENSAYIKAVERIEDYKLYIHNESK